MGKNKVKCFTENAGYTSVDEYVEDWMKENPHVNIVSTETMPGNIFKADKVTIIYNYDD